MTNEPIDASGRPSFLVVLTFVALAFCLVVGTLSLHRLKVRAEQQDAAQAAPAPLVKPSTP